jgi:hypothetical protein
LSRHKPLLQFLAAWTLINVTLNLRYPGPEPVLWYLIPSLDTVWLFSVIGLVQWSGRRVPNAALIGVVALLLLARLMRLGDGLQSAYYSQTFNVYTDLPLAPELVRFAHSTLPWWKFWLLVLSSAAGLVGLCLLLYRALGVVTRYLASQRQYWVFAAISAVAFVIGLPIHHRPGHRDLFLGGLGSSIVPRLQREAVLTINISRARAERGSTIARVQAELQRVPHDLAKLGGADVHLVLIESYGRAVVDRPQFKAAIAPVFAAIESELGALEFTIASGFLESSTYGGRSWLAHATLGTGIRTSDQFQYDLVTATKPKALASFFRAAGYRTVLVQPATTRPWPKGEFYGFEKKYYSWDFDYAGPSYAWATMPDQYILDFVRRRELDKPHPSLFIQYVLISSHAPWSDLPPVLEDWSKIGNGAIYKSQPTRHYPIEWPDFSNASEAYLQSIVYDFEVLKRYVARFITDRSLIIMLGDHQPVWDVNGGTLARGVPIHVLSRNPALIAPFQARGYGPGMWPAGKTRGMETFLPDLLRDFSTP